MSKRLEIMLYIFSALLLFVLCMCVFANSMVKESDRDEQMYCTAGVMMAQGKTIYKDFPYIAQMPYHPLFYAGLFKLTPTTQYLLTARISSAFFDIIVVIAIIAIYRRILGKVGLAGILLGLAAAVVYVFNPIVDYANGYAWNNDAVVMCVVVALWLFISADFSKPSRYVHIAFIGAILTVAVFMRITTAAVWLVFFVAILLMPVESGKGRIKNVIPFVIASVIFSIWPIYTCLSSPKVFFLDAFRVQLLNSQLLIESGMVHDKLAVVLDRLTTPGYLSLLAAVTAGCTWTIFWGKRGKITSPWLREFLLPIFLAILFFAVAFIHPTVWIQHLAMPVPFLIISMARPIADMKKQWVAAKRPGGFVLAGILVVCAGISVIANSIVIVRIPLIGSIDDWVPVKMHRTAEDIAAKVGKGNYVLTLAPLYALQGGCRIYPELSAGVFVYRVADRLSDEELRMIHAVSPDTLKEILLANPPSGIFVGVEPDYEDAFFETASSLNWQRHDYSDIGPILFYRP